jgi:hypothetical protein
MQRLSPVSACHANGTARRTRYAAPVRSWLAILVTLAACADPAIERLATIQKEVCACKTASCAEQAMTHVPQGTIKSTPRTQAIAREMRDCLAKLQAAERPVTDPDAEDSAAEPPAVPTPTVAPPVSAPRTAAPGPATKP